MKNNEIVKIPNNPKMFLDNFVDKLNNKTKIVGINDKLYQIMLSRGHSFSTSAKFLKIPESTLRSYIRYKHIPFGFLKKFIAKYECPLIIKKIISDKTIYSARNQFVKLPINLSPKLAYFIGYLHGDGYIGKDRKRIEFADEYKEQMEMISHISFDLFNTKGQIRDYEGKFATKPAYKLDIVRKAVHSYLHDYWEMPIGFKKNLKIHPKICSNKECLRWYLRGIFDADGTLPKNPNKCKQIFIDIALKELDIISQIKKSLDLLGITTHKPYPRKSISPTTLNESVTWELRIRKKSEILKFLKEVGFIHPNKSVRQKKLLDFYGSVAQHG